MQGTAPGRAAAFTLMLALISGSAWPQTQDTSPALRLDNECVSCDRERSRSVSNGRNETAKRSMADVPMLLRLDKDCPTCQASDPLRPSISEAILAIQVNLEAKGDFLVQIAQNGDVLVRESDLRDLGVTNVPYEVSTIEREPYVSLRSLPGVTLDFDRARLVLSIRIDPRTLARRQVVDLSPQRNPNVRYPAPAGAFFNYNVTQSHDDLTGAGTSAAAGEFGWRLGEYLLTGDAIATEDRLSGETRRTRLNTSLIRDWRDTLQRLAVGDFVTVPQSVLGSSLRLGGVSLSRRFDIDPYYVRFPGQIVSGTAALPSEIFIFSNGALVRRERVSPGTFDLQNLVSVTGLQVTEVVVRDVLGNEQRIVDPFYFTDTLLREGLDEYSIDIGAERRDFGTRSNNYGAAGLSTFYRRGISDSLTLGARAEALDGRANLGPTATMRLGTLGVLSTGLAYSSGPLGDGAAVNFAHTYQSRRASASVALRFEDRAYARAASSTIGARRYDFSATASYSLSASNGVGVAFTSTAPWGAPSTRTASVTYRQRITRDVFMVATARHSAGANPGDELLFSLTWSLDGPFAQRPVLTAQAQRQGDRHVETLQLSGGNPDAEGPLYRLAAERQTDSQLSRTVLNPLLQYNFTRASVRAEAFHDSLTQATRTDIGVQGGVAAVGGEWALSRPVRDSFAIVKVGDAEGVRVYANNQSVGRTGSDGTLFVPRLASYFENPVAVEDKDLPLDYTVPETRFIVSPALRSGVLLDFRARQVKAVAGKLVRREADTVQAFGDADGSVTVEGKALPILTARDGSFYVENVAAGRYRGEATRRGERCGFELRVPESREIVVDLREVTCEN